MADLQVFKEIAEQVLTISTRKDASDGYLIDRAYRILRHCGGIARLGEVQRFQIDHDCLYIAAMFRDAGFAHYANQEDKVSRMVLADLTDEDTRDFSTQIVQEKLEELLTPERLERVCGIIIESGKRNTTIIEAMILSDARNLDDMGAIGIFNEMRCDVLRGRGVAEALASWNRKIEYDYWTARLREGFRFESVRSIAEQRLLTARKFMAQLEIETRAADMEDILLKQQQHSIVDLPAPNAKSRRHLIRS
ncbi:MAG: hypothetical protein KAJ46_05225 [Sedimentisphaerales bacterium]|nr:hypothetical protein [Sedimentisphaerales bacterium]